MGHTYICHKDSQGCYKEPRVFCTLVRNEWAESRNFLLLITGFCDAVSGLHIQTKLGIMVQHMRGCRRMPPECQKNTMTFAQRNGSMGSESSSWDSPMSSILAPNSPGLSICYPRSWFLSWQTELCIPQADFEIVGSRYTLCWVYEVCLWLTVDSESSSSREAYWEQEGERRAGH